MALKLEGRSTATAVPIAAIDAAVETDNAAVVEKAGSSATGTTVGTVETERVSSAESVVEVIETEVVSAADSKGEAIPSSTRSRYRLLDVARGVTLINMIAYHLLYDLVYIFGVEMVWYTSNIGYVWQQAICWTFILISGISCNFSRGNMMRGARLLLFGAAMTVVTMVAMPEQLVVFGVLSFLGCAGIIYAVLEKPMNRLSAVPGLAVSAAAFLATKGVPSGFVGVGDVSLIRLPGGLYNIYALFPLGFPSDNFYSSDYFPIIPWIFLYLAGFYLWRALKDHSAFELREMGTVPLLELIGRNTLPIYLLHQPVIYGVLGLIFGVLQR